jgi:MFS family permease
MLGTKRRVPPTGGEDTTGIFRLRAFRFLAITRVTSLMSSQMMAVVVGWQVYDLTRSALALGLLGLVQLIPSLFLTLVSGEVADRFDRRAVARGSYLLRTAVVLGLLAVTLFPRPPVLAFYGLMLLNAVARTFEGPSLQSLLPSLVSAPLLSRAIAAYSSLTRVATLLGPSIGGFIYAFGVVTDYVVCIVLFAVAAAASLGLPAPRERTVLRKSKVTWDSMLAGVRYIWSNSLLFSAISLDLCATLFGGLTALLPIFARDILEIGPLGLGVLRSTPAVGALVAAACLARFPVKRSAGYVILGGAAVYGVANLLFGISRSVPLSLLFLFFVGAGDAVSGVNRKTLMQVMTPGNVLGRVTAVNSLSNTIGNQLGQFESGVTAAWFGAEGSAVFGGVAVLAFVAVWAWRYPNLRRIERADAVGMVPGPA